MKSKKGTWGQAILTFLAPVLVVGMVRWILVEPFVIPSGSMIPTLLIYDHIFVNKLSYGIHVPYGHSFIWQWSTPERNEIAVFRYPENPDVYFVKRIVGIAGDEISVKDGNLIVNGVAQEQANVSEQEIQALRLPERALGDFNYFRENGHLIRYKNKDLSQFSIVKVPEKSFFVVGDNRDQSSDSRFWGVVPEKYLIGKAKLIWLSCDETLASAQFLCNPQSLRWNRMFSKIQ